MAADALPQAGEISLVEGADATALVVIPAASNGGVFSASGEGLGAALVRGSVASARVNRSGWLCYATDGTLKAMKLGTDAPVVDMAPKLMGAPAGRIACGDDGSTWVEGAANYLAGDGSMLPVPKSPARMSPVPYAKDAFGNLWTLAAGPDDRFVAVLPAQDLGEWKPIKFPGGGPRFLVTDESGHVWVADAKTLGRFDPRDPAAGWLVPGPRDGLPDSEITALGVSASGRVLVGFASGELAECDREPGKDLVVTVHPWAREKGPIRAILTDSGGVTWVVAGVTLQRRDPPDEAWQKHWQLVARLPFGNHDTQASVIGRRVYMAGGLASARGFPTTRHVSDAVWEMDWDRKSWRAVATMPTPRYLAGTGVLDAKLWIVNGQAVEAGGKRATASVLIYDPVRQTLAAGPPTTVPRGSASAGVVSGRLYVCGRSGDGEKGPLLVESIAPGEKEWRGEAAIGSPRGPAWGCGAPDGMFIQLPFGGLVRYDAVKREWDTSLPPPLRRAWASPMVADARGVWLFGGRGGRNENQTQHYSIAARSWKQGPDLPRPMAFGTAAVVDGSTIVIGGAIGPCFADQTYMLRRDK